MTWADKDSYWNKDTIYRARKALFLSQQELADALECRQQTVSEWELGEYIPRKGYQAKLTAFFEFRIDKAAVQKSANDFYERYVLGPTKVYAQRLEDEFLGEVKP